MIFVHKVCSTSANVIANFLHALGDGGEDAEGEKIMN